MTSNEVLFNIFAATLQADKSIREEAEQALGHLSVEHSDLVVQLLHFCTQAPPLTTTVDAQGSSISSAVSQQQQQLQRSVLLACAIRARNVLGRSDWNRIPYFTESVKEEVRRIIVPLQCEPQVSEHVRRQLLAAASELVEYDYPTRWPQLVPQLSGIIDECVNTLNGNGVDTAVYTSLLRLKGALGVLRCCCKVHDNPLKTDADDADAFAARFIPSLISLCELLHTMWSNEALRVQHQGETHPEQAAAAALSNDWMDLSSFLTELSHCMRLVLKCCLGLFTSRFPQCLCSEEVFQRFWVSCVDGPVQVMRNVVLPLTRDRLERRLHSNPHADRGDNFLEFQQASVWRLFKWCQNISFKLVQEFISPKSCEARATKVATAFSTHCLSSVVGTALDVVRWHAEPIPLTSKAYIMSLEILTMAVSHKKAYLEVLHPRAEELMTMLLFPRLCFSAEDAELWQYNPEEYVRKQTNPGGDLFSAKVVSASLLLSLAVPTKKFQDSQLLSALVNFIMNQLQVYSASAAAAEATHERQDANPVAFEAARRVDAAFYCLYQFKRVLASMNFGDDKIEFVLSSYVVPATKYPLGFLRARAVLVLSTFATSIQWSSSVAYQDALRSVLPLLNDPEAPVRVQTCVSFSRLTRHSYAREVITPCIAELIQHYFNVMRLMDNEAVVRTLRKTISYYHDTLSQWAVELTDMIVAHFAAVLHNVSGKYDALSSEEAPNDAGVGEGMLEDDGFADTLMAADELLETLTTLVRSLPDSTTPRCGQLYMNCTSTASGNPHLDTLSGDIFMQLQLRISPVLYTILSHSSGSTYGFMDPVLRLLTTLLSRSPAVAPVTWRLLPCLHAMVTRGGAADYFGQMLAPLDNYASVEPLTFLFVPLQVIVASASSSSAMPGDGVGAMGDLATLTPAQMVFGMGEAVLASTNLRNREIACVPKVMDSMLQNYWAVSVLPRLVAAPLSSGTGGILPATCLSPVPSTLDIAAICQQVQQQQAPSASEVVAYIARSMLIAAGTRQKQSSTLRVLLANTILSCFIADAAAATHTLGSLQATASFFEQYVHLVQSGVVEEEEEMMNVLRSYDRSLFALAVSSAFLFISSSTNIGDINALQAPLCGVVESGVLQAFAEMDITARQAEIKAASKLIQKLTAAAAAAGSGSGGAGGDSEEEDWDEDDFDEDEETADDFDDDGDFMGGEDGDGDDWAEDDDTFGCGAACDGGKNVFESLVQRARALRGGADKNASGGAGADDFDDYFDEDDDNLLDEDGDDFESPIDVVNAWAVLILSMEVSHATAAGAAMLKEARFQSQADVIVAARDATQQSLSLRAQVKQLSAAAHGAAAAASSS